MEENNICNMCGANENTEKVIVSSGITTHLPLCLCNNCKKEMLEKEKLHHKKKIESNLRSLKALKEKRKEQLKNKENFINKGDD